jgi:hypothetical protein
MKLEGLKELVKEELKRALNETRQTLPLKDLNRDNLSTVASPIRMTGIDQLNVDLPLPEDSLLTLDLNSEFFDRKLESYKDDLVGQFGADILNSPVILDPSEVWFRKVKINDRDFLDAKEQRSKNKMAALQGLSKD